MGFTCQYFNKTRENRYAILLPCCHPGCVCSVAEALCKLFLHPLFSSMDPQAFPLPTQYHAVYIIVAL